MLYDSMLLMFLSSPDAHYYPAVPDQSASATNYGKDVGEEYEEEEKEEEAKYFI